jgi:hypothetical protein
VTLKPPHETFVRTDAELIELWRDLMGSDGFDQRSLWVIFLWPTGEMCRAVMPVDDIPVEPDERLLDGLRQIVGGLIADDVGSAAFLLSRPGSDEMSSADRHWAGALRRTLGPDLCAWPIHLATHGSVRVFAPDDLLAA